MALFRNTAEGQADGTVLTAANSGGGSGDALATVTGTAGKVTFSSTGPARGSRCYAVATLADTETSILITPAFSSASAAAQCWRYFDGTAPSVNQDILTIRNASGNAVKLVHYADNTLIMQNAAGQPVNSASGTVTAGWHLLDVRTTPGTSTTNGVGAVQATKMADSSPWWSSSSSTMNAGTAVVTNARFGYLTSGGTKPAARLDDVGWNDGATAFIARPANAAPTVGLTGADRYVIDATTSTGTPTLAYAITQVDGTATTPVAAGTGRWTVQRGDAPLTYSVTVTDGGGAQASQNIIVPAAAAAAVTGVRRYRKVGGVFQ